MEGGITRFSSGIAGVAVVLFALMGTIGVGYLLNGSTGLQTVNDYNYVTDVSGLYSYTPVPAYAAYSPATNNYQYSDSLATLGEFTSGISYTPAGAANLNPIVTPSSGIHTYSESRSVSSLTSNTTVNMLVIPNGKGAVDGIPSYQIATTNNATTVNLQDFVNSLGEFSKVVIHIPTLDMVGTGIYYTSGSAPLYIPVEHTTTVTNTCQPVTLVAFDGPGTYPAQLANSRSQGYAAGGSSPGTATTATSVLRSFDGNAVTQTQYVGTMSDITVEANGLASWTYTVDGGTQHYSKQASSLNLLIWTMPDWTNQISAITYDRTVYEGIEYLDPNAGVSLDTTPVYWSNGNDLGSTTWAFQKPTAAASIRVAQLTAGGQTMNEFVVSWSGAMWQMTYLAPGGTQTTVDIGSGWQAVYVRAFYTGELQTGPIDGFFNFTSYTLGPATTYATSYTGNVPIDHCQISGSTTMKFACIGTTVESGTVPGAMFDATFAASTWFPELASVRVSFDSAAYVGSAVRVGSWTMAVDSGTFIGDLQDVDGLVYRADLTQPWAVTWNPGSTSVSFTFTPYQQAGTQTITILADDDSRTVNLDGQWAIDTDLYSVGTHIEEAYEWNFGNWGLDKEQFIVCAMGLTALLAIAFRLARVPFHALDFVVIFLGNLILWVIM